jgi:tetratricopeptide (TPR) repeat protein
VKRGTGAQTRLILWLSLAGLIAAGVLILGPPRLGGSASLSGLNPLLQADRFDEAESLLTAYLHEHPESAQANMLMAQVALARQDQKPDLALRHLAKVRPHARPAQAIVRLNEGKAFSALGRYPQAEQAWLDALRIDPLVPEAGWALLGLYYVQGRRDDAHHLAMTLHASEPDAHDRVQLLLELLRQDAKTLVEETLVDTLKPIVTDHPEDLHSAIAQGRALVHTSRPDEGLAILRVAVARFAKNSEAWDAMLTGLEEAFRFDELDQALSRLPASLASEPRFAKHRGALAQSRRKWTVAATAYRRAREFDPFDEKVLYRLCQVERAGGHATEIDSLESLHRSLEHARGQALRMYEEANAVKSLGRENHHDLCQRIAHLRERMGRPDEALQWHRLVLKVDPRDPVSRAAAHRLSSAETAQATGF